MFKGLSSLLFLSYTFFTLLLGLGTAATLNKSKIVAFTHDSSFLGSLWVNASYSRLRRHAGGRVKMSERVELRVRSIDNTLPEIRLPLYHYEATTEAWRATAGKATVHASPDSAHIAALCATQLLVYDSISQTHRTIEYRGEFFRSFSWRENGKVAFVTSDTHSTIFWKALVSQLPSERQEVFRIGSQREFDDELPPLLLNHRWSPRGRFVSFRDSSPSDLHREMMIDFKTSQIHQFDFSLFDQSWNPDESLLWIQYQDWKTKAISIRLFDSESGKVTDISNSLENAIGPTKELSIFNSVWTVDGEHLLMNLGQGRTHAPLSYVIKPNPFEVVSIHRSELHWSPKPNWVFVRQKDRCRWFNLLDASFGPTVAFVGSSNWSPDGRYVAEINDANVWIKEPQKGSSRKRVE